MKITTVWERAIVAGEFAQRLGHETRLKSHMGVAHLAFDFRLRHQRRDGVDNYDIDGAAPDQRLGNFQRLFAMVRLRDEKIVSFDAEFLRIAQIQRMLGVDIGAHAAELLRFGDDLQRQSRFAGRFRSIDFHHSAARHAADAERDIEAQRAGGDDLHVFDDAALAKLHDRALAELLFDLAYGEVDCFLTISVHCCLLHVPRSGLSVTTLSRL